MHMKTLEQTVMARVRRAYYMRKLVGPTALKAYGLVVCAFGLFSAVSIVNIVANMPSVTTPAAFGSFLLKAVTNTEVVVQLLLVGAVVAAVMLVRDIVRGVGRHTGTLAHV